MGLLSADLDRHRTGIRKVAFVQSDQKPSQVTEPDPLIQLEHGLDRYAGATQAAEKTASEANWGKLWLAHEDVEKCYRWSVKAGKRLEADKLIDKYAGWAYLKGQPGEPGDLHPLPAPDEK